MKIFRLLSQGTVEERIVNLYQLKKLEIAEIIYQASYFQFEQGRRVPVTEKLATAHMGMLYKEECLAMVPFEGVGTEITTDIECFVAMTSDIVVFEGEQGEIIEVEKDEEVEVLVVDGEVEVTRVDEEADEEVEEVEMLEVAAVEDLVEKFNSVYS